MTFHVARRGFLSKLQNIRCERAAAGNDGIAFYANNRDIDLPGAKRNHVDKRGGINHHDIVAIAQCCHVTLDPQIVMRGKPGAVAIVSDFHGRREGRGITFLLQRGTAWYVVSQIQYFLDIAIAEGKSPHRQ